MKSYKTYTSQLTQQVITKLLLPNTKLLLVDTREMQRCQRWWNLF